MSLNYQTHTHAYVSVDALLDRAPIILFVTGMLALIYGFMVGIDEMIFGGMVIMSLSMIPNSIKILKEVGVNTRKRGIAEIQKASVFQGKSFTMLQEDWKQYNTSDFMTNSKKVSLKELEERAKEIKGDKGLVVVNYDPHAGVVWIKEYIPLEESALTHTSGISTIWAKYTPET
jgi:hypothetical protein